MNYITETQALEKLNAKNFREISKGKILEFMSTIPNMEPEVAKQALGQFQHFATSTSKVFSDYKDITEKAIGSSRKSLSEVRQGRNKTKESLSKMLENENLSLDEQMAIVGVMMEIDNCNSEDQVKNYEFVRDVVGIASTIVVIGLGAAATILGGSGKYSS